MKRATIRRLRHDTTTVFSWVADGETVEVRQHGDSVALHSPARRKSRAVRPDFAARLTAIYGRSTAATAATEVISEARSKS